MIHQENGFTKMVYVKAFWVESIWTVCAAFQSLDLISKFQALGNVHEGMKQFGCWKDWLDFSPTSTSSVSWGTMKPAFAVTRCIVLSNFWQELLCCKFCFHGLTEELMSYWLAGKWGSVPCWGRGSSSLEPPSWIGTWIMWHRKFWGLGQNKVLEGCKFHSTILVCHFRTVFPMLHFA